MVLTVCLSPSVDVTIELDSLNIGKINVVKNKTLSFTGKALNVAIGVSRLGSEAYATGFMYNENGAMFERALDKEGVPFAFVWNSGRVRENYKCIDQKSMLTEINDVGGQVGDDKLMKLLHMIRNLSSRSNVTVISGGLPRGVNEGYYRDLFRSVDPHSLKIADTEGLKLFSALEAGVAENFLRRVAERVQRVLAVPGVAVLMVCQLREEHLVDEVVPGLVLCNGRRHLRAVALRRLVEQVCVLFLDVAAAGNAVDFLEVFLRVEAPAPHHLVELFLAERKAEGEGVKFLLLPLAQLRVFVHGVVSFQINSHLVSACMGKSGSPSMALLQEEYGVSPLSSQTSLGEQQSSSFQRLPFSSS